MPLPLPILVSLACLAPAPGPAPAPDSTAGQVVDPAGRPVAGAVVSVRTGETTTLSVYTDSEGRYRLPAGVAGSLSVRAAGFAPAAAAGGGTVALTPAAEPWRTLPAGRLLGLLPAGAERRTFILDCTGCHQFDAVTTSLGDGVKDLATWRQRAEMMTSFAGAESGFPIIAPSRDPVATAAWLGRHVTAPARAALRPADAPAPVGDAVVTAWALPAPADLPHDVALAPDGRVVVTGMFTHQMYLLDPDAGTFTTEAIPVENANPRAVEIAADGTWWVLLGAPMRIARRRAGTWTSWPVDLYGHSLGVAPDGRVWTNGHFTQDPERIAVLDPASDSVRQIAVPGPPSHDGGRNIQYELRVAPDGAVWMSQLAGNRLVRYDPRTGAFARWELPTPHSGPRRFDVAPDGRLWIPEYANNRLARFDPATGTFTEWELPVENALPYVARVDAARGAVWIGSAAADALFRFDLASETFRRYPLPTPGAIIRHLAVDPATGAVWAVDGASPARGPVHIFRVEPR